MTLFINFSYAARPLGVAVLSRISASLPTYSPMVIRFLKGHPYMNQGSFWRFLSFHQQDLYKGTHLCQNWALLEDLLNRQRIWTLQVQGKIELNQKQEYSLGTGTQQLYQISRELITIFFTSGHRFCRMIHVSRFALKVLKTLHSDNCLALLKKLGNEKKFLHLSCTLESSLSMVSQAYLVFSQPLTCLHQAM